MKRTCSFILTLILTFSLFQNFNLTAEASSTVYGAGKVTTASTSLNVRKSASTSSAIITTLKRNSQVTLINKSGNFWYVRYSTSGYGYCSADYITVTSKVVKTVKTTSGNLNVRNSASTSGTVLTKLSSGTKVPVISTSNGWSKILYNGNKSQMWILDLHLQKSDLVRLRTNGPRYFFPFHPHWQLPPFALPMLHFPTLI